MRRRAAPGSPLRARPAEVALMRYRTSVGRERGVSAVEVRPDLAEVEDRLLARWPETRIEPSLDRITMLLDFLGTPQRRYRSVHLTGTNGKTSTARLVEALLAAGGHRTGRLTSPHLTSIRERIALAGRPIGEAEFVDAWR